MPLQGLRSVANVQCPMILSKVVTVKILIPLYPFNCGAFTPQRAAIAIKELQTSQGGPPAPE